MMHALTKAMKYSISEVFETMCFMPLEFIDKEEIDRIDPKKSMACRLSFSGALTGLFLLWIPLPVLLTLSENFTGIIAEDISQDYQIGTIKEFMNMIAGNTFSIYNDQEVFEINIPEVLKKVPDIDLKNPKKEILIRIKLEQGQIAVKLTLAS